MAKKVDINWLNETNPVEAERLSSRDDKGFFLTKGVYLIHSWNMESLAKKIAAVDRKLAKYSQGRVVPVSYTKELWEVFPTHPEEIKHDSYGRPVPVAKIPYIKSVVYIAAARIQIGSIKQVMGRVDRIGSGDNIVVTPSRTSGDNEAVVTYITNAVGREIRCDHCGSNRRRNGAWVLEKADGSLMMVADACAQEYFGQNVAGLLGDLMDLDDTLSEGGYRNAIEANLVFALTIGTVGKYGFVSQSSMEALNEARTKAGLGRVITTNSKVAEFWAAYCLKRNPRPDVEFTDHDAKMNQEAEALIASGQGMGKVEAMFSDMMDLENPTPFQQNFIAVLNGLASSADFWKYQALVVAGVAGWMKVAGLNIPDQRPAFEQDPAKKPTVKPFTMGHPWEVGSKLRVHAVVERVQDYNSAYGVSTQIIMRSESGHKLLTYTRSQVITSNGNLSVDDLEVGTKLLVLATVKAHKVYEGRNGVEHTTELSRPTLREAGFMEDNVR